jgi:hypothetical protein
VSKAATFDLKAQPALKGADQRSSRQFGNLHYAVARMIAAAGSAAIAAWLIFGFIYR